MKNKNRIINKLLIVFLIIGIILTILPASQSFASNSTELSLSLTEWEAYLIDHENVERIYNTLKDMTDENGSRVYSDQFIIGLISNIMHEGNLGVVEYQFSKYHCYNFELPSGGTKIQSRDDIDYLLNWGTSNDGTEDGKPKKGSCGVSSVQWSYNRRITYLKKLKLNIGNKTEVYDSDLAVTDLEMIVTELKPDGKYYKAIMSAVGSDKTAENYAEAFCDHYFLPSHCDQDMSTTGESCLIRRETASELWRKFNSKTKVNKKLPCKEA
jgi:hypothetical protein